MSELDQQLFDHIADHHCFWPDLECSFEKYFWLHCTAHKERHCLHCEQKGSPTAISCIGCQEEESLNAHLEI